MKLVGRSHKKPLNYRQWRELCLTGIQNNYPNKINKNKKTPWDLKKEKRLNT